MSSFQESSKTLSNFAWEGWSPYVYCDHSMSTSELLRNFAKRPLLGLQVGENPDHPYLVNRLNNLRAGQAVVVYYYTEYNRSRSKTDHYFLSPPWAGGKPIGKGKGVGVSLPPLSYPFLREERGRFTLIRDEFEALGATAGPRRSAGGRCLPQREPGSHGEA